MFLPLFVFCAIFGSNSLKHVSALNYKERIVGGLPTNIEKYPYQIHIVGYYSPASAYTCGGSIISETWILTAAHCLAGASKITGRYGSSYKNKEGTVFEAKTFFTHELHDPTSTDYDIGLIELYHPLNFSTPQIKKIKLAGPTSPELTEFDSGTLTGWGTTTSLGQESEVLRVVTVPIVTNEKCQKIFPQFIVNENNICAGLKEGGKDSCQGDSGGPLVVGDVQVGIVSWGIGCGEEGAPGVYTKVAAFSKWINDKISAKKSTST